MTAADPVTIALRWAARTSGTLLFLLVVVIAIGEGAPNPFNLDWIENLELLGLTCMTAGFIAGWKAEKAAAIMILGGFLEFWLVSAVFARNFSLSSTLWLFLIPGILYLIAVLRSGTKSPA
jgi:hypothetical protein